ncbi:cysteine proteinase [Zopfia rhizophila CBS 207.26]|uniref:Cysteine proteinase n=1 Tax=Zopfia rhizophila CBS 207.26 TaxID=1314779 RepID=A0A6A6ELV4_9PEZI|nr:cysteine proteinase [Zopfia rhizophila CBS 207.26]
MNTLDGGSSFHSQSRRPTTQYGKSGRQNHIAQLGFPFDQQDNRSFGRIKSQSPPRRSAVKRRKVDAYASYCPTYQPVINLDDDESVEMQHPTRRHEAVRTPLNAPPASSRSQHSYESGRKHKQSSATSSGFHEINSVTDSHRKRTRKGNEVLADTPRMSEAAASSGHQYSRRGSLISSPIPIDDDEPTPHQQTPRRSLVDSFKSGDKLHPSDLDDLQVEVPHTSNYFAPKTNSSSRVNSSIVPRQGMRDGESPKETTSPPLRNMFKRSAREQIEDGSEDELQMTAGPPVARKAAARSNSPPKPAQQANMAARRQTNRNSPSGWPLRYAGSYELKAHGPDLSLKHDPEPKVFQICRWNSAGDLFQVLARIECKQYQTCSHDDEGRIRILGSRVADLGGDRRYFDIQFLHAVDAKVFLEQYMCLEVKDMRIKTSSQMELAFSNGLPRNSKTAISAAIDDPEIALLQARTQNGIESRDRRQPRKALLVSQLETDSQDAHPSSQPRTAKKEKGAILDAKDTVAPSTRMRPKRTSQRTHGNADESGEASVVEQPQKFSVVHGLGEPWKNPVNYTIGRRRATVEFQDLFRLDEGEFLNDSLIDFYMLYLFEHANVPANKVYLFNTHFYTSLTRPVKGQRGVINYDGVSRWTSRDDLFAYDYILVPINEDAHWYLAIICNVPNINRKMLLDDVVKGSPGPESQPETRAKSQPELKTEPQFEAKVERCVDAIANRDATDAGNSLPVQSFEPVDAASTTNQEDPNLFEDEQDRMRLVGESGVVKKTDEDEQAALGESKLGVEETVRMEKLSINDDLPVGILGSSYSSSPPTVRKKSKRKSGPPLKKLDPDEPVILILDSLGGTHPKAVRHLKDYIKEEGKAKRQMDATITQNAFNVREIPMQDNFVDCGVFVLGYMQKFFANPREFVTRILTREMGVGTDWPDMEAPQMRNEMRTILRALADRQEQERKLAKPEKKARKAPPAPLKKDQPAASPKPKLQSPIKLEPSNSSFDNKPRAVTLSDSPLVLGRSPMVVVHKNTPSPPEKSPERQQVPIFEDPYAEVLDQKLDAPGFAPKPRSPKRRKVEHEATDTRPSCRSREAKETSPRTSKTSPRTSRISPRLSKSSPHSTRNSLHSKKMSPVSARPSLRSGPGTPADPIELDDSPQPFAGQEAKTIHPQPPLEETKKPPSEQPVKEMKKLRSQPSIEELKKPRSPSVDMLKKSRSPGAGVTKSRRPSVRKSISPSTKRNARKESLQIFPENDLIAQLGHAAADLGRTSEAQPSPKRAPEVGKYPTECDVSEFEGFSDSQVAPESPMEEGETQSQEE